MSQPGDQSRLQEISPPHLKGSESVPEQNGPSDGTGMPILECQLSNTVIPSYPIDMEGVLIAMPAG